MEFDVFPMAPPKDTIYYLKPVYTKTGYVMCPLCGSLLRSDASGAHCLNTVCNWDEFPQSKSFIQDSGST